LVFLPDLLHFWLSGELTTERSIASTSSMLAVKTGEWDTELLSQLGLPTEIFGSLVEPGTVLGPLLPEVAEVTGASTSIQVITPASHDTASAVAAVPATGNADWAYLSSGTWSLLGAELDEPIYSAAARQIPLTNERGVAGSIRLLKNIGGLWLVQELRRELQQQGDQRSFAQLAEQARQAEALGTLIDPSFAEFAAPGNMAEKIRSFARNTNQPVPESVGQLVRCCLESLALCYDQTLGQLETVLGRKIDVLHIVGGGTQNTLLNELTAAATGRAVITGPVEATAIGNLLVQSIGCGSISGLEELRQVVARSFEVQSVAADENLLQAQARERYAELVAQHD
jgi:rhamnulokinase